MTSSTRASNSFYNKLKDADLFGEQIIFTINTKSSYRSFTGLLFSFFLCCIGVVMFVFMGQSFFFRMNPLITASTSKSLYAPLLNTTDDSKMFVAFQFSDSLLTTYPADGSIFYFSVQTNTPNISPPINIVPAVLCRESVGLDQNYLAESGLLGNNMYCMSLNSDYFGGSDLDMNYTYFQISINFCYTGYTGCNFFLIQSSLDVGYNIDYIDFFYPEVFFDPNNSTNPLVVKHSKVTDAYLGRSSILREVYFQNTVLIDDMGWIFQSNYVSSKLTVGTQNSRSTYKISATDQTIGRYFFYVGPVTDTFTRKYQKLQDVIAIVGGFLKICQMVMKFFLSGFVKYLRNIELMNGIINWKDDEDNELPKNMNDKSSLDSKFKKALRLVSNSLGNHRSIMNDSIEKDLSNSKTNIGSNYNKNQESVLLDISQHTLMRMREPGPANETNKNKFNSKVDKNTHKKSEQDKTEIDIFKLKNEVFTKGSIKKKKFYFELTFSELIKKMMCRRILNKKQFINVKIYDYAERYLIERLDVFGYLDLINEVNKIKSIFFNSQQISSFNYIENPTIPVNSKNLSPENIDNLKYLLPSKNDSINENDAKKISEYFTKKIFEQTLSYADKVLLVSQNEDILREILLKLFEIKEKMRMNKNIKFKDDVDVLIEDVLNF